MDKTFYICLILYKAELILSFIHVSFIHLLFIENLLCVVTLIGTWDVSVNETGNKISAYILVGGEHNTQTIHVINN